MITEQEDVPVWPEAAEGEPDGNYHDPSPEPVDVSSLPRLVKVECVAEPRHAPMWMEYDDEAWYPPSCPDCAYVLMRDAHAGCQHSHHGRWRRWRITNVVAGWAYSLGILAGYGSTHDGHCNGCLDGFRWRTLHGRAYLLGWPAWKWSCLLKKRHWPGGYVGFDCCTKCLPCPVCGSTEWDHDALHQDQASASEADEQGGGRHRLSREHPGWEAAPEELEALLRQQGGE